MYKNSNPNEERKIKIAIVDDHQLFSQSLKRVLESYSDLEVILELSDGIELERSLDSIDVDIILMDILMPRQNGIITCQKIIKQKPALKIIGLSAYSDEELVLRMIEAGARGYFTKNAGLDELYKGIVEVHSGGYYFDHSLGKILSFGIKNNKRGDMSSKEYIADISEKELEILKLVCCQMTNKQMSNELCLSVRTIETHRRSLIEKTQSKNMIGVVVYAFQRGLIDYSVFDSDSWRFMIGQRGIA